MRCDALVIALPMMALVLGGCSLFPMKGSSGAAVPKTIEEFAGQGPYPVHGVSSRGPGPQLFQQVLRSPQLTAFLRSQKSPDTIEVVQGDEGNLEILLVYSRPSNPPPRRIVVEQVDGRMIAFPPTKPDGSLMGSGRQEPVGRDDPAPVDEIDEIDEEEVEAPLAEIPKPTEIQNLECPIDPERPDCQTLCAPGAPYEWCL